MTAPVSAWNSFASWSAAPWCDEIISTVSSWPEMSPSAEPASAGAPAQAERASAAVAMPTATTRRRVRTTRGDRIVDMGSSCGSAGGGLVHLHW
ncbi:hypothetical protein [Clavibacter sp.]|uniref:hypothetical protein n=1 Tax=Clavibacter sp. TaxID=1871044 RepID=UPI002579DEB7|nr:hypothetical protein [Clavibacter sp.]